MKPLRETLDAFEGLSFGEYRDLWMEADSLRAKLQAAEAEAARLKEQHQAMSTEDTLLVGVIDSLQAEVARLRYVLANGNASVLWRGATEAALRWAWINPSTQRIENQEEYIQRGLAALLDGRG